LEGGLAMVGVVDAEAKGAVTAGARSAQPPLHLECPARNG
jgi:hypothetical protein